MSESYTEKRACERIPTNIAVRFSCDHVLFSVYYGTVTNISKNGMLVKTGTCFPYNTDVRLFIYKKKILLVHAKVKRVVKKGGFYEEMGIQVVNPDKEYLNFVENLKKAGT